MVCGPCSISGDSEHYWCDILKVQQPVEGGGALFMFMFVNSGSILYEFHTFGYCPILSQLMIDENMNQIYLTRVVHSTNESIQDFSQKYLYPMFIYRKAKDIDNKH